MRQVSLVKTLNDRQSLYRCSPAYDGCEYVVISISRPGMDKETYAFQADSEGKITSWSELRCSRKGIADHKPIIQNIKDSD